MKPKIKYIAAYRVAPISAITHLAEVKSIEQWEDTNKYVLNFTEPAQEIKKVQLGKISSKAPQSPRYSSKDQILQAETLDDIF